MEPKPQTICPRDNDIEKLKNSFQAILDESVVLTELVKALAQGLLDTEKFDDPSSYVLEVVHLLEFREILLEENEIDLLTALMIDDFGLSEEDELLCQAGEDEDA